MSTHSTDISKKKMVEELLIRGDNAMAEDKIDEALQTYTEALTNDDSNDVLYSKRSDAYIKKGYFAHAMDDAEKAIVKNPNSAMGWLCKGIILNRTIRYEEALKAFEEVSKLEPENEQMKDEKKYAEKQIEENSKEFVPIPNPFKANGAREKLQNHPYTGIYFKNKDEEFMKLLDCVEKKDTIEGVTDGRLIACMAVLLEVELTHFDV